MNFDTPLALFQHLLATDEDNMTTNLSLIIDKKHKFYNDVIALISAHEQNKKQTSFNSLIGKQAEQLIEDNAIHELLDKQIGVYKLVKKLGQGGMGAVYLGERNDGLLEQKVAVKFVYPSIAAIAGEDFLQKEAQHLANLDHVNIAKIYTVDKTKENLPFMVMEYVDGLPLDQYCDEQSLNLEERLKLFKKVCSAVQSAHQNMIIHADIKPSNILVDKQGEPKLMDFGIACSLSNTVKGGENTESQQQNRLKALSREYASPEQKAGKYLTATSDIYSLGKLLLTLIERQKANLKSNELKDVVHHKCTTFVEQRFQSVTSLITLLELQEAGFPVKEHSTSFLYRGRKLFQRNFLAFSFTIVLFTVLILSSIILFYQNQRLVAQKAISSETAEYIVDIFRFTDPDNFEKLTVQELLDKGRVELNNTVFSSLDVEASIKIAMSTAYKGIGSFDTAIMLLEEVMAVIHDLSNDDIRYDASHQLALMYITTNKFKLSLELLEKNRAFSGKSQKQALMNTYAYGDYYFAQGMFKEAIPYYEKALAGNRAASEIDLEFVAIILNNLGSSYQNIGDDDKALQMLSESLSLRKDLYGNINHPKVAIAMTNIGGIHGKLGNYEEAATYLESALGMFQELSPEGHRREAGVVNNLGALYLKLGNLPKAIEYLLISLQKVKEQFGDNHMNTAILSNNVASAYRDNGQYEKAIPLHKEALRIFDTLDVSGVTLAVFKSNYAKSLLKLQHFDKALSEVNEATKILADIDDEHRGIAQLADLKKQILEMKQASQ